MSRRPRTNPNETISQFTTDFLKDERERRTRRPRAASLALTSNPETWEKGAAGYNLMTSPLTVPDIPDNIAAGATLANFAGDISEIPKPKWREYARNPSRTDSTGLPMLSPGASVIKRAVKASDERRKKQKKQGTKRKMEDRGGRRSRKKRTKRRKRKGGVKGTPSTGRKGPNRRRQPSRISIHSLPVFNRRLRFEERPRPSTSAMTATDQVSPHTMQIRRLDRDLARRRRERRNIARSGRHDGRSLNTRMDESKQSDAEEVFVVDTHSESSNDKENTPPPGPSPGPGGGSGFSVNGGRRRRKTKRRRRSRKKRTKRRRSRKKRTRRR